MSRWELAEWIVMLLLIVAWWPRIFLGYDPLWYHILIYYVSPVILILICVRRFRANQAGFRYSERMIQGEETPDVSGDEASADRPQPPRAQLPFVPSAHDDDDDDKS
jgi:hypothetical protein